jgi:putative oxidoreductase
MQFGLLLVHAFVGALLAAHGAQKLFGWFGGYGLAGTGGYLEGLGFCRGRAMAVVTGTAELVGGTLFALGLVSAVGAVIGGSEYVLTVSAVVIGLSFNGPGAWSLDRAIGWSVSGLWWGVGAAVLALVAAATVPVLGRRIPAPAAAAV